MQKKKRGTTKPVKKTATSGNVTAKSGIDVARYEALRSALISQQQEWETAARQFPRLFHQEIFAPSEPLSDEAWSAFILANSVLRRHACGYFPLTSVLRNEFLKFSCFEYSPLSITEKGLN